MQNIDLDSQCRTSPGPSKENYYLRQGLASGSGASRKTCDSCLRIRLMADTGCSGKQDTPYLCHGTVAIRLYLLRGERHNKVDSLGDCK
jgi:hypothetical protein